MKIVGHVAGLEAGTWTIIAADSDIDLVVGIPDILAHDIGLVLGTSAEVLVEPRLDGKIFSSPTRLTFFGFRHFDIVCMISFQ